MKLLSSLSSFSLLLVSFLLFGFTHVVSAQTTLKPGDLAVVGMDFNLSAVCPENSNFASDDIVAFMCFVDIAPGTKIIVTDNAFLREDSDGSFIFRSNEGAAELTRTGPVIPKGTVFYIIMGGQTFGICDICSDGWSVNRVEEFIENGNNSVRVPDMAISNGDQLFVLQGDYFDNDVDCSGTFFNRIVGRFIYAASSNTSQPWLSGQAPVCSIGSAGPTSTSYLPQQASCLNIPLSSKERGYVRNLPANETHVNLLSYISNSSSWKSNVAINMAPTGPCPTTLPPGLSFVEPDFITTVNIVSDPSSVDGIWTGAVSTDWYDACNWILYRIPDSTTNVLISAAYAPVNDCNLDENSPYKSGLPARCKSLTIENTARKLRFTASDSLRIFNQYTNNVGLGGMVKGTGKVDFRGSAPSRISVVGNVEEFHSLAANKTNASFVDVLGNEVRVSGNLMLGTGVILSSLLTGKVLVTNASIDAITNTSAAPLLANNSKSWVSCPLSRNISNNSINYAFPVGKTQPQMIQFEFDGNPKDYTELLVEFVETPVAEPIPPGSECGNDGYDEWVPPGFWTAVPTPATVPVNRQGNYKVRVLPTGILPFYTGYDYTEKLGNASVTVAKSPIPVTNWTLDGECDRTSTLSGTAPAVSRVNIAGGFSKFAILVDSDMPFPLEELNFEAQALREDAVRLSWNYSKVDPVRWTIQRSTELPNFQDLHEIRLTALEPTARPFSWIDLNAPCNQNLWYRLAMQDLSGRTLYSDIREVSLDCKPGFQPVRSSNEVFPNPFSHSLTVRFSSEDAGAQELILIDVLGRTVAKTSLNEVEGDFEWQLPEFNTGVYHLEVRQNGAVKRFRLIHS